MVGRMRSRATTGTHQDGWVGQAVGVAAGDEVVDEGGLCAPRHGRDGVENWVGGGAGGEGGV